MPGHVVANFLLASVNWFLLVCITPSVISSLIVLKVDLNGLRREAGEPVSVLFSEEDATESEFKKSWIWFVFVLSHPAQI